MPLPSELGHKVTGMGACCLARPHHPIPSSPSDPLGLVQLETHLLTINSMEKLLLMDTTEARRKAISKGLGIGSGVQRLTHRRPGAACLEASRPHAHVRDNGSPTQAVAGVREAGWA